MILEGLVREFADLAAPAVTVPHDEAARRRLTARVHKLRGSGGTVGAREVHRLATVAEQSLTQADGDADAAVADLARGLRALFDAAAPVLAQRRDAPRDPVPVDGQQPITGPECDDLLARLRQQSMSAIHRFDTLEPRLNARFGPGVVQEVRRALDDLDFARALGVLEVAG